MGKDLQGYSNANVILHYIQTIRFINSYIPKYIMTKVNVANDDDKTTISINKKTVERLKQLWEHADETYDSVINRLIDGVKK